MYIPSSWCDLYEVRWPVHLPVSGPPHNRQPLVHPRGHGGLLLFIYINTLQSKPNVYSL
jgi:hypothetical protein